MQRAPSGNSVRLQGDPDRKQSRPSSRVAMGGKYTQFQTETLIEDPVPDSEKQKLAVERIPRVNGSELAAFFKRIGIQYTLAARCSRASHIASPIP